MPKTRHLGSMASYGAKFKDSLNGYAISTIFAGWPYLYVYPVIQLNDCIYPNSPSFCESTSHCRTTNVSRRNYNLSYLVVITFFAVACKKGCPRMCLYPNHGHEIYIFLVSLCTGFLYIKLTTGHYAWF